jgi:hypothetical protein
MNQALTIAVNNTVRKVSPKDASKLYAKYKEDRSWCIDMSGNFPILLHALTNHTASTQDLKLGFTEWAHANKIKVECASYPAFLATLPDRVMSLLPRVYGLGMRPCGDRFITDDAGIQIANIFNPAVMPAPGPIPAPFDATVDLFGQQVPGVLAELFARVCPDEAERKFLIQRLAACIQNPMRRVRHAVFLVGEGGTGKSTILDILETALCRRHVDRTQSYSSANDPHSEALCNNRVLAYEDKPIGNGGEAYVYTALKQTIDYDRRTVNIKHGQRAVQREVYCNIFVTTNNENLFPWDSNERRFFAPRKIVHLISEQESAEFFTRLHTFLQLPETAAFLYHWLSNVNMEGFDYGRCPRTPYMQELINQSGTMLEKSVDDFIDGLDIFHPRTLTDYLAQRKLTYKSKELKEALEARGLEYKRIPLKCDGFPDARFSVWRKKPGVGRHFRDLTTEEKHFLMTTEGVAYQKTT